MNTTMLFAALCISLVASGCAAKYDYVAETQVKGVTFRVGLKHAHPYLAEYKKFLEVERDGGIELKELFPDTGGYGWVVISENHGNLEIKDFDGIQLSIPKTTGTAKTNEYIGRFDFDGKHVYRFIPASADPREPQPPQ